MTVRTLVLCISIVVSATASIAVAKPNYVSAFQEMYPGSTLTDRMNSLVGSECWVCHQPPSFGEQGNCYREDIFIALGGSADIEAALIAVDGEDSDGDGVPNGVEIMTVRADDPSQVGYSPGLIGEQGRDPCSDPAGQIVTGENETPTITCAGDTNGDDVVDIDDIVNVVLDFGGIGDANGDGNNGEVNGTDPVDIDDIVFVVLNFGNSCP